MEVTLVSRYFDTRNSGAGSHSKLIYESLNKKNIKVNKLSQENSLISSKSKLSYVFYTAIDLKRLINKSKFKDTDVFHSLTPLESFYLPKNKSVTSILDFIPLSNNDSLKSSILAKYFNRSIQSAIECEKLIVNNVDLKNILVSKYKVEESNIEVISPPIDNKYYPTDKKNDTFVIGTISELSTRKRVDILINSFLKANIENSKLLIGGSGSELENLKKLSKNDERIKFLGFVPDEEMNSFYNSLDVFVFPTIAEGYGMPIVEAMACKKPVITLEDANIPTNIKEKTYVCKKEELSEVLLNKKYHCNLKENLEFFKEHSLENISSKLIKVYESI